MLWLLRGDQRQEGSLLWLCSPCSLEGCRQRRRQQTSCWVLFAFLGQRKGDYFPMAFSSQVKELPFLSHPTEGEASLTGVQVHGWVRPAALVPDCRIRGTRSRMRVLKPNPSSSSSFLSGGRQREGEQAGKEKKTWKINLYLLPRNTQVTFHHRSVKWDSKLDAKS